METGIGVTGWSLQADRGPLSQGNPIEWKQLDFAICCHAIDPSQVPSRRGTQLNGNDSATHDLSQVVLLHLESPLAGEPN